MILTHRAPCGGKSSASESATEVIQRVTMAAGELRTAPLQNALHLRSGHALGQQMPGDPQVHDAPVGLRKALRDTPSLHAIGVDRTGLCGSGRREVLGCRSAIGGDRIGGIAGEPQGPPTQHGGVYQGIGVRRQTRTGVHDFHPGAIAAETAAARLLIDEPGESAHVTPVGAGRVAAVTLSQVPGYGRGKAGIQRSSADVNPGLQVAGTNSRPVSLSSR